ATLLSGCTFEHNIEEFRRKQNHTHEWSAWYTTLAATCTAKGEETRVCTLDATHKETRETPVDTEAHRWTAIDGGVAPTCTEDGHGRIKCDSCGEERDGIFTALGHDHGEWHTIEANCENGARELRCTRCGEILETETIPAIHDWGDWEFNTALSSGEIRVCKRDSGHTETHIFYTSVANMGTWLSIQPANTAAAPYAVALKVDDLGGDSSTAGSVGYVLNANDTKYVSLDLSGSTFTSFGRWAFYDCSSLASVTIPNSVTYIEMDAFYGCASLASVIIPGSVTGIGMYAFEMCSSLASVTIPNSVTYIGTKAFCGCASLAVIDVTAANTAYSSVGGVLYNKTQTTLIQYPAKKTGASFAIPGSVTSIDTSVFIFCDKLASIKFEGTVASSGFNDYAFNGLGDLRDKFYETDPSNGTPGTYTRTPPLDSNSVWQKQP
ncbi:MAG: leucine-rich repeat domain-containing protein, partial [Treponema sp.]|nr:leucine-rich repeat domain-containing protein [Treponema sp.]